MVVCMNAISIYVSYENNAVQTNKTWKQHGKNIECSMNFLEKAWKNHRTFHEFSGKSMETSGKSMEIYGNSMENLWKLLEMIWKYMENLWKSMEIQWKSMEILWKIP